MAHVAAFLAFLLSFIALDAIWLGFIASSVFQAEVGHLLRPQPDLTAAALFYIVYAAGAHILVVEPAARQRSPLQALIKGGVLGLTAYGTFDLTSLAVIKGWTVTVAVLDMAWGLVGTASASLVALLAATRLAGSSASAPERKRP